MTTTSPRPSLGTWDLPAPRRSRSDRPWFRDVLALVVIGASVLVVWSWPAWSDFANLRLSNPGDSESFAYYLSWNLHAWGTGQDPFFTPNLYAPGGLDLGNAISMPGVSLLVAPVSLAFGGTAGYNVAFLLSIFFGGVAVYLLAKELFNSIVGAVIASELMIVNPYYSGHALGHLNLMWVFGLPLIGYLVLRRVKGRLGRVALVIGVALTVAFTTGASTELLVTQTVFTVIAYLVASVVVRRRLRARLLGTLPWTALGAILGVLIAVPVIFAAINTGIPDEVLNPPSAYATDLTNVIAPSELMAVGEGPWSRLWPLWGGGFSEDTGFIPLILIVLLLVIARRASGRVLIGLAVFSGIALILSFGPYLTIGGVQTLPLPWLLALEVPGLDHVLPGRFSIFVYLGLVLIVAQAWKRMTLRRITIVLAAAIAIVVTLPNLVYMRFPVDARDPGFVDDGQLEALIRPGENVLVLPPGQWGPGMRWQDKLDFTFDMPTGNGGGANLPDALDDPVAMALWERDVDFDFATSLRPYLQRVGVTTVIVDQRRPVWKKIADDALGDQSEEYEGVWVWKL